MTKIEVSPSYSSFALTYTPEIRFYATGIYSDGLVLDLTENVTWNSSNEAVATVNNALGKRGLVSNLTVGATNISAVFSDSAGDITGETSLTLTSDAIVGTLQFTPSNPSIAVNTSLPFKATVIVTDGTVQTAQDITEAVVWTSSDLTVAPIQNTTGMRGIANASSAGPPLNRSATMGAITGTATVLTVTNATLGTAPGSLVLSPVDPFLPIGVDYQLRATGIFASGTTYAKQELTDSVVWSSSNTTVATVCNADDCRGVVTTLATGTTTISAQTSLSAASGTTQITVQAASMPLTEIQVTPTNPSVYLGAMPTFTATGIYSDGTATYHQDITDEVTWSSSDTTKAVISNRIGAKGNVTNLATGTTTITASAGSLNGTSSLTIMASTLALNSIEVTPNTAYIPYGQTQQFKATGIFTDGTDRVLKDVTNEVIWTSSETVNAPVSNAFGSKGVLNGVTAGTSGTITATLGAINGSTTFEFSDTAVFTGVLADLEISPPVTTIGMAIGSAQQLKATAVLANTTPRHILKDVTDAVVWVSSDPSIATVSNDQGLEGFIKAMATGSVTITAYWRYGGVDKTATKSVNVGALTLQSIQVIPSAYSSVLNLEQTFQALGIYSDGSTYAAYGLPGEITWQSTKATSSTILAPISNATDNKGQTISLVAGISTVKVQYGSTTAAETLATVNATLEAITIYPIEVNTVYGIPLQFKAYGTYSDNTTRDITNAVWWASGTPGTAVVSNDPKDKGLVTPIDTNSTVDTTTEISAYLGDQTVSTTLTVKPTTTAFDISEVQVTPSAPKMGVGTVLQLAATGVFTNGANLLSLELTNDVYWFSSNSSIVTISNEGASSGQMYAVAGGSATITASWTCPDTDTQQTGSITVTILDPGSVTVTELQISPSAPTGPLGLTQQLSAIALYSNFNTQDVTESVLWTSSDKSIITVNNLPGSKGQITRKAYGSATITARFGTSSVTTEVSVW